MATTWPTRKIDSALAGDPALVLGRDLFDRDQCVKAAGSTQYFSGGTSVAAGWTTVRTFGIRYPNFFRSGELVRLTMWVSSSAGGTAHFRVQDSGAVVNGTDVTTTSATLTLLTSAMTAPDNTWAGAYKTVNVQVWITSGTLTYSVDKMCANLRFGD